MQTKTSQRESIFSRVVAVLVAIVLATSFVNLGAIAPQKAWAAEDATVALTIVDSTDGRILCNKAYTLKADDHVSDLLEAAGFSGGDQTQSADNEKVYFNPYGDVSDPTTLASFLGKGWVSPNYWQDLFDGNGDGWENLKLGSTLIDGGHYQFIYGSEGSFEYSGDIPDPLLVTVALTIVDTTTGKVLDNNKYALGIKKTVFNLLEAAGFSGGDQTQSADNEKVYFNPYGDVSDPTTLASFLGKGWVSPNYWQDLFDGNGDGWENLKLGSTLIDGGHYQFIYGSEGSFTYSGELIDPLLGGGNIDPEPDPDPAYDVNKPDAEAANALRNNLIARFAQGGSDDAIDNFTVQAAIALGHIGAAVNSEALVKAVNSIEFTRAGTLAKYIVALEAAGVDVTNVEGRNLIKEMESLPIQNDFDLPYMLPAYTDGGFTPSEGAKSIDDLISALTNLSVAGTDSQTLAEAALALIPYQSKSDASEMLAAVKDELKFRQLPDGGFGYDRGDVKSNDDATSEALAALVALGMTDDQLVTENGSTPVGYLLSMANASKSGMDPARTMHTNEAMCAAAALEGLVAAQTNGYVHDFKKVNPEPQNKPAEPSNTAATGDAPTAAVVGVLALGSLVTLCVARRRMSSEKVMK